ncbi:hypothetical protein ABQG65_10920 [Yersinia alsatica]|uniref:hypothetical protein n=1 Tax=Yersinia alsatica TaxID=2890317 RepID=UPI0032ED515E
MINIMAILLSSFIFFSPLAASSIDNLLSKIKINNSFIIGMMHIPVINHKNSHLINYNSDYDFPVFTLTLNHSSYHRAISSYEISFSLESEAMLNYNVSLLNSHNIALDNQTGFVNNSKKTVNLKMLDILPGSYKFILEIIDNKKQMKEITHTIVIP